MNIELDLEKLIKIRNKIKNKEDTLSLTQDELFSIPSYIKDNYDKLKYDNELLKIQNNKLMIENKKQSPEFEIQVQGPILIQYSNRRFMAGFKSQQGQRPLDPDSESIITKVANDAEFPSRLYPFYDNPHGHFMYLFYDRCLLNQLDKLKNLPLSGWLIDGRGESDNYFKTALCLYKKGRDHYFINKKCNSNC